MLRRLIVLTAVAAGLSIAAAVTLATPALAKGPSQARISGPGLARTVVVSGDGEPGQPGILGTLALQTRLFSVMFGPNAPIPPQLPTPSAASLGPGYTIIYTVYGEYTQPGQQYGQIHQDLYPRAAGGPVIYTPPRQPGGPLPFSGWFRASRHLPRTLAKLGIPPRPGTQPAARTRRPPAAHPAAAQKAGSRTVAWLIASAAAIVAATLAGAALWLRHRNPAIRASGNSGAVHSRPAEPRCHNARAGASSPGAGQVKTPGAGPCRGARRAAERRGDEPRHRASGGRYHRAQADMRRL